jgi:hypothetical protein
LSCSIRLDRIQPSSVPPHWIMTYTSSQFTSVANHIGAPSERSDNTSEVLMHSVRLDRPSFFCTTSQDHGQHHLSLPLRRTTASGRTTPARRCCTASSWTMTGFI